MLEKEMLGKIQLKDLLFCCFKLAEKVCHFIQLEMDSTSRIWITQSIFDFWSQSLRFLSDKWLWIQLKS